jgi:hypothetical protein
LTLRFRRRQAQPELAPPLAAPAPPDAPPEEGAREITVRVMRAAPDVRYRAARSLGLLDGLEYAMGPEREIALLGRAQADRQLGALEEAIGG